VGAALLGLRAGDRMPFRTREGCCLAFPEHLCELLWRDACLAEAKLLLAVAATSEEVGDAVSGVGEPLDEAREEGRKENVRDTTDEVGPPTRAWWAVERRHEKGDADPRASGVAMTLSGINHARHA
jgi:hypothetical protein